MLHQPNVAVALLGAVVISGCATPTTTSREDQFATDEVAACVAKGGFLERVCRLQTTACLTAYKDGGKPCSGKSDCEGLCVAKTTEKREQLGDPIEGHCQV